MVDADAPVDDAGTSVNAAPVEQFFLRQSRHAVAARPRTRVAYYDWCNSLARCGAMAGGGISTVRSVLPLALLLGSAAVHRFLLSRQQARRGEHEEGQDLVLKQVQHPSLLWWPGLARSGTSPSPNP